MQRRQAAPQAAGEGPRQRVDASAGRRDGGILAPWRDDGNHALARLVEGKNGAAAARPQALGIARHAQQDAIQLEALGQGLQHQAALALKARSEEHTSELQSLMRISYAVFCLKKKKYVTNIQHNQHPHKLNNRLNITRYHQLDLLPR